MARLNVNPAGKSSRGDWTSLVRGRTIGYTDPGRCCPTLETSAQMMKKARTRSRGSSAYRATGIKLVKDAVIEYEAPVNLKGPISFAHSIRIGAYSYVLGPARFGTVPSIGRFCSIAPGVTAGPSNHPVDWMSTSPFQYSKRKFAFAKWPDDFTFLKRTEDNDATRKLAPVTIGNDVWIGSGVTILNGVSVGDGAIIAAGSVVTKSVPPYAIVGGIPAKLLRMRFPEPVVELLAETAWWNYDISSLAGLPFSEPERAIEMLRQRISDGQAKLAPPSFATMAL